MQVLNPYRLQHAFSETLRLDTVHHHFLITVSKLTELCLRRKPVCLTPECFVSSGTDRQQISGIPALQRSQLNIALSSRIIPASVYHNCTHIDIDITNVILRDPKRATELLNKFDYFCSVQTLRVEGREGGLFRPSNVIACPRKPTPTSTGAGEQNNHSYFSAYFHLTFVVILQHIPYEMPYHLPFFDSAKENNFERSGSLISLSNTLQQVLSNDHTSLPAPSHPLTWPELSSSPHRHIPSTTTYTTYFHISLSITLQQVLSNDHTSLPAPSHPLTWPEFSSSPHRHIPTPSHPHMARVSSSPHRHNKYYNIHHTSTSVFKHFNRSSVTTILPPSTFHPLTWPELSSSPHRHIPSLQHTPHTSTSVSQTLSNRSSVTTILLSQHLHPSHGPSSHLATSTHTKSYNIHHILPHQSLKHFQQVLSNDHTSLPAPSHPLTWPEFSSSPHRHIPSTTTYTTYFHISLSNTLQQVLSNDHTSLPAPSHPLTWPELSSSPHRHIPSTTTYTTYFHISLSITLQQVLSNDHTSLPAPSHPLTWPEFSSSPHRHIPSTTTYTTYFHISLSNTLQQVLSNDHTSLPAPFIPSHGPSSHPRHIDTYQVLQHTPHTSTSVSQTLSNRSSVTTILLSQHLLIPSHGPSSHPRHIDTYQVLQHTPHTSTSKPMPIPLRHGGSFNHVFNLSPLSGPFTRCYLFSHFRALYRDQKCLN
ncbi:hypothetical protein J6590_032686 [Homalodisca vitripennis]|nr:hypothetical protein J6590_032686 [Homalodisca vitripennis]